MEPIGPPHKENFRPYETTLLEAIEVLFQSLDDENADIEESFAHEFFPFVLVRIDPPFEALWIKSALTWFDSPMHERNFLGRIELVRNQFSGFTECSVSCGFSKSVALLAPVCLWISGLFVYVYSPDLDFDSKTQDAMMVEIRLLVESMLSYVTVCCSDSSVDDGYSHRLCRPLEDLLALWMADKKNDSGVMTCTFSALTDEIRQRLSRVGCEVGELAGAVSAQLLLMGMGLIAQTKPDDTEMEVLEKELKRWTIATLTGIKNLDLFVILLQVLVERKPSTGTLGSDVGTLLRKVLYDVMLVDYTFLDLECEVHPSFSHLKSIALMRLIVAFEAVESHRQAGDQSKAISCEKVFSTSRLSTHLVKLVPSSDVLNKCKRNGSSPIAFLKWFHELERQGVRIFPDSTAKYSDNLSLKLSETEVDRPVREQAEEVKDRDAEDNGITFCIDKVGDINSENEEELNKVSNVFVAAAHKMNTAETNKGRKRKAGSSGKGKKK